MGSAIDSTQERVVRRIVEGLQSYTDIPHNQEVDFGSQTLAQPQTFSNPEYNIRLQLMSEIPRMAENKFRINISIGITRNFGDVPYEQDIKVNKARDQIIKWFRKRATTWIGARVVKYINADTSVRGSMYVSLLQFELVVFQIKGEY